MKDYTVIYSEKNGSGSLVLSASGKNKDQAEKAADEHLEEIVKDVRAWRWQETNPED